MVILPLDFLKGHFNLIFKFINGATRVLLSVKFTVFTHLL